VEVASMITSEMMEEMLKDVEPGAILFVSYEAGGKPSKRAIREAEKAENEGYPKRWFVGRLTSKRVSQNGDLVITLRTTTRYDEDAPGSDGNFRTLNPRIGRMLSLEVVERP
jgi:ribosomal protein S2